jgi:drug/metabolite transporter (DMT)-like permease
MVKTINFVRLLTIILFVAILAMVYAYLPVQVQLIPSDQLTVVHREYFFYGVAGFFLLVNIIIWFLLKMVTPEMELKKGEELAAWFNGLPIVINLSIIFLIGFIGVMNNSNHIKASSYAYLNFLVPVLILIWIVGFIYFLLKKNNPIHYQ